MLDVTAQNASPAGETRDIGKSFVSHEIVEGDIGQGLILVCDHARNDLPEQYGTLGLAVPELERHIAFDIGVEAVTRQLARRLNLPVVLSMFSRLLIDPNRGQDDPTLIMRVSDGVAVPGNADIDDDERQRRVMRYYAPYHRAISGMIDGALALSVVPALFSIHSFTPMWKATPRPWQAGLLWDERDRRFGEALLAALSTDPNLVIGGNEPYRGGLCGDTMDIHGTRRGLANALLEIRQDLISDDAGIAQWVERLTDLLPAVIALSQLHEQLSCNAKGRKF